MIADSNIDEDGDRGDHRPFGNGFLRKASISARTAIGSMPTVTRAC
jgi:hypothetical protein